MKVKIPFYWFLNLIEKIKDEWTDKVSNYIFECGNCKKQFDGSIVEQFIKHQIDLKHFDDPRKYTKRK